MRVESINGTKYVLVIVDDYSRYTWTHFLRSKDETLEVLIDFLILIQRGLHAQVRTVKTNKGTKFLNKTLQAYFSQEGNEHQMSTARTPEQNGIVKRQNRTLVEAAQTMLSAAKIPLFFWAEAIATSCFTQNRSLVIPRHKKTPYHIINGRKPTIKFFHIFGSLCYIVRYGENLDKMKEKGNACIFVGYSTLSKGYRVYNKRRRLIVETIYVKFDKLPIMASDHVSFDPVPQCQTMDTSFELTAFLDSNHAGCLDTRKSTSGGIQFLGDYGFHFDKIPTYCDSKAAIAILWNPVYHSRTKHIDVRYHFIKEHVERCIVELFFVETEYQLADVFTKALSEDSGDGNPYSVNIKQHCGTKCQFCILIPIEFDSLPNVQAQAFKVKHSLMRLS
nr:retrovirus-related Pol polyprotein from transposon TNT 1-94 [Tanacetum cinerariifolium]